MARLAARADRAEQRVAFLEEELRIKDARMARIPAQRRPHYPPTERLAILALRAAAGWAVAETARRFALSAVTVREWMHRALAGGDQALVQTQEPVNRFPSLVKELVRKLKVSSPSLGHRKVAQVLARAGLQLSTSSVRRFLKHRPPATPSPGGQRQRPDPSATPPSQTPNAAAPRAVTARYAHHVWHVDLTATPIWGGFWVPWVPQSLLQDWPFCWWIAVAIDHHSRAIVGTALYRSPPSTAQVCAMLDAAAHQATAIPRYLISDQGPQFGADYAAWCVERGIRPRFGAI